MLSFYSYILSTFNINENWLIEVKFEVKKSFIQILCFFNEISCFFRIFHIYFAKFEVYSQNCIFV